MVPMGLRMARTRASVMVSGMPRTAMVRGGDFGGGGAGGSWCGVMGRVLRRGIRPRGESAVPVP